MVMTKKQSILSLKTAVEYRTAFIHMMLNFNHSRTSFRGPTVIPSRSRGILFWLDNSFITSEVVDLRKLAK